MPVTTAVVTGASSGIGRALAEEIAGDGYDLVLIARRADRLDALAAELSVRHGAAVEVLVADLTSPRDLERVVRRLEDDRRPVDRLVNCAGAAAYGSFSELPVERLVAQSRLHLEVPLRLMHAVLPQLLARRTGGVLNVASTAGLQATPGLAAYAASKAALVCLSESVHHEVRRARVQVTCVCPGYTRTELQDRAGVDAGALPDRWWMSAESVARSAWRGHRRGRALVVPGTLNRAGATGLRHVPRGVAARASGRLVARITTC